MYVAASRDRGHRETIDDRERHAVSAFGVLPAGGVGYVWMPGMDGAERARGLRALDPPLPVVLVSADHRADPGLPGVPFLPKPVDPDDLWAALDHVLAS